MAAPRPAGAGAASSTSATTARQRRQSHNAYIRVSPRPAGTASQSFANALVKHGKYVAAGAAGIWWLDLWGVVAHIPQTGWARRMLNVALGCHGLTVILFLYLTVFLPWFRGHVPNYPNWQQSRRLRVIVPLLTVAILLGWSTLVFALTRSRSPPPYGAIRDAIRQTLHLSNKPGLGLLGALAGSTAVYTLTFGILGFIPAPNVPVRAKRPE